MLRGDSTIDGVVDLQDITTYFILPVEFDNMSAGILWFFLFLLGASLVVLIVMAFGGVLVALVSLLGLLVLPTVRRQVMLLAERISDREFDSIRDLRFIALYVVCVDVVGIVLILVTLTVVNFVGRFTQFLPTGQIGTVLVGVIAVVASVLLIINYLTEIRIRLRTVGEWSVFLCFIVVLTVASFFFTPSLFFILIRSIL